MRGVYKPSTRMTAGNAFEKAAINCLSIGANPVIFVEAAFQHCRHPGGPMPNQLNSGVARSWYAQTQTPTMEEVEADLKEALETTMSYCIKECGQPWPSDEFMQTLLLYCTPGQHTVKMLLAYNQPKWRDVFMEHYGEAAKNSLIENPSFAEAANKHHLPATAIIQHPLNV